MTVAYISGHMGISEAEWIEHYVPKINKAIAEGHYFVIGDARGVDVSAQLHLMSYPKERVTIYHMFDSPRFNKGNNKTKGGFKSDEERDSAMTRASHYDIAWVRPGREGSGTAKNIACRNTITISKELIMPRNEQLDGAWISPSGIQQEWNELSR